MQEIWRPFNNYEVNTAGKVMNSKTGRIMKPGKDTSGYMQVVLFVNGSPKNYKVHRLVAQVFPDLVGWTEEAKGRPFSEIEVNHINEDKTDNRVENLEWCSREYNVNYGTRNEKVSKSMTNGKLSKTVYQYTLDGQLVKVWPSTMECSRNGFSFGCIAACCRGQRSNHKGFMWSYNPPQ